MTAEFDVDLVRRQLAGRFGLLLSSAHEEFDGGEFEIIRPIDLEKGNGFGIVLSRTHRQVEASFRADNFAGILLRRMSEADPAARTLFSQILKAATASGTQVYVAVNGIALESIDDSERVWRSVEFDVTRRLPPALTSASVITSIVDVASACMSLALSLLTIEELSDAKNDNCEGLPEGALMKIQVNRYERSPVNRAACIAHHGTKCQACGFNFSAFYGAVGEGYIEVHHRTPVSKLGPDYIVNPLTDLVPVCSNCHSVLHRTDPPLAVESLRAMLMEKSNTAAASEMAPAI